jgi:uncharacterized protein (DUF169 family)
MADYGRVERLLIEKLSLERRPIAIAFPESAPQGVTRFTGSEPAGCGFWRLAAGGQVFYTAASDHYNCPIGSYTHNIPLPADREPELGQTLELMTGIGYLRMEEVPGIPRLPRSPEFVLYAPLGKMPMEPKVVLLAGKPASMMLFEEAAIRAGVTTSLPLLARPTCMAVPAALAGSLVAGSGCIGNRIYTGLGDDELYVAVPGKEIDRIADELDTIAGANQKLTEYHQARVATLRAE